MIKPQHDSQGKRSPDPCERRGRQTGSARMKCYNVSGQDLWKETWP
jgi:hypothetical protein